MNKIEISIIVPVYNVENYISTCLDSLVDQKIEGGGIEVICVNDGSTDKSYQILREYQEKCNNILLINQRNKGLSGARNEGLKAASGKYIYFCDSDDWIQENTMQKAYSILEKENLEIIHFEPKYVYDGMEDDGRELEHAKIVNLYDQVLTGTQILDAVVKEKNISPCIPYLIIKHDLIRQNKFDFYEGILHEDHLFYFRLLMAAKRVMYIRDEFYYRRLRPESITHSVLSKTNYYKHFFGYAVTFNEICVWFTQKGRQYEFAEEYLKILYNEIISLYIKISRKDRKKSAELYMRMKSLLKESEYLHSVKIVAFCKSYLLAKWTIGMYEFYDRVKSKMNVISIIS